MPKVRGQNGIIGRLRSVTGQTERPAADSDGVRLMWKSRRTSPRWCRVHPAWCRRAPPVACRPDACSHLASLGPGDVDAPEEHQHLSSSSRNSTGALWSHWPYLDERAVAAVPHDALHAALWAVLEPQPQLKEVHRWRISHSDTPVGHQAVNGLLLAAQLC